MTGIKKCEHLFSGPGFNSIISLFGMTDSGWTQWPIQPFSVFRVLNMCSPKNILHQAIYCKINFRELAVCQLWRPFLILNKFTGIHTHNLLGVPLKGSLGYHLQEHPEWKMTVKLSQFWRLFLWHELRTSFCFFLCFLALYIFKVLISILWSHLLFLFIKYDCLEE